MTGKCKYKNIDNKAVRWTKEFSWKKIIDGKNLVEFLEYENTSLWWSIDIYNLTTNIIRAVESDRIDEIIDKKKYSKKIKPLKQCKRKLRREISKYMNICQKEKVTNREKIILLSNNSFWRSIITENGMKKHDIAFHYLIDKIQEYDIIGLDFDTTRSIPIGNLIEKIRDKKIFWKLEEGYVDKDIEQKTNIWENILKERWNRLSENMHARNSFTYNQINIWDFIKGRLEYIFLIKLPEAVRNIEIMKRILEEENPKAVILSYETGSIGRAACYASKIKKIKSIALQHGELGMSDYYHTKNEISGKLSCPIPDKTCVYGSLYKKILLNCLYPKNKISVVGKLQLDAFKNLHSDRKLLCKKMNLDQMKKIIVFASQPLNKNLNNKIVFGVINAVNKIKYAELVIKIHPGENQNFYDNIIKNNSKNISLAKDIDILGILCLSDILITKHSTVAIEAAALGKPVIIFNPSGEPDPISYVKDGIALGAYNELELKKKLTDLLYNKKISNSFEKQRNEAIKKYIYKNDGKTAERIAKLI
ncbi:MAG: UDP-N-acetylglucosamine 2-epimerase [Candidatus Aenigmarchaeota archaeon]|nr:UDP-N-acetylglucosamine 2-epimerase [Candidatus Aenigmarchaeota archaeon]